jgi:hypothetical protein
VRYGTLACVAGVVAIATPALVLGQGSNLGSYGAQFVPGAVAGTVSTAGAPVPGLRVVTSAGHTTTTNAQGAYVLYVDAPGLYDVSVSGAGRVAGPVRVAVTMGATTTLNFTSLQVVPRPRRNLPVKPPAPGGP